MMRIMVTTLALLCAVMSGVHAEDALDIMTLLPGWSPGDSGLFYQNPLLLNIADPRVIRASDGMYYMYPTGWDVYSSPDLAHWTNRGAALRREDIAYSERLEAGDPGALEYKGKYYLFYSFKVPEKRYYSSVAISDKPIGPFVDTALHPRHDFGYSTLDSIPFIDDDGKAYLYYSWNLATIGNHRESRIYGVELTDNLLAAKSEPQLLLKPEQSWEGGCGEHCPDGAMRWNEAPFMMKRNGIYYLMYSANSYAGRKYSIGYATAHSPLGPFVKYEGNPILYADYPEVSGTGRHAIVPSPDGTELLMLYHSHMDPRQGGEKRQLAMDRVGFRTDGSMYVNGPTLTQQPMPAGASLWTNIADEAEATASSTKAGTAVGALQDGESGVYRSSAKHDWVSAGETNDAWVKLSWPQERIVTSVLLHNSADPFRRIETGRLILSDGTVDGTVTRDIVFPKEPGAAAIIDLPPTNVQWMQFVVKKTLGTSEAGLSEVVVLGLPLVKRLAIKWNGSRIYGGSKWPEKLIPPLSTYVPGANVFEASMVDVNGANRSFRADVSAPLVRINAPDNYARLTGTTSVAISSITPHSEIAQAYVRLVRIVDGEAGVSTSLYSGSQLPTQLPVNTALYVDGAYDVVAGFVTNTGVVFEAKRRLVFANTAVPQSPSNLPGTEGFYW